MAVVSELFWTKVTGSGTAETKKNIVKRHQIEELLREGGGRLTYHSESNNLADVNTVPMTITIVEIGSIAHIITHMDIFQGVKLQLTLDSTSALLQC